MRFERLTGCVIFNWGRGIFNLGRLLHPLEVVTASRGERGIRGGAGETIPLG